MVRQAATRARVHLPVTRSMQTRDVRARLVSGNQAQVFGSISYTPSTSAYVTIPQAVLLIPRA